MVAPVPLGTLLRQRYLIQQILGQGGFGRTYLALDQERFGDRCVLKEFSVPYEDESLVQKSKALFQREANALYQIQHPQVPRFWAAFEEQQRLFLVQDFVEGKTYRSLLRERKLRAQTFTEAEVRHLLQHMLPVLMYIHDRGIIHRDISPDNIILPAPEPIQPPGTGLPVLIDFGAVKEATTHWPIVSAVTRVGKVGYAPPEQLQTGKVYPNSDLYALAATCYVLLTSREPQALLDGQTLTWRWQPYAKLSNELVTILNRMLAVYPGDRYQNAKQVLADLQAILETPLAPSVTYIPEHLGQTLTPSVAGNQPFVVMGKQATPPESSPDSVTQLTPTAAKKASRIREWRLGLVTAGLVAVIGWGGYEWYTRSQIANTNGEVWISGTRVPQSEASRILAGQNSDVEITGSPDEAGTRDRPVSSRVAQPQAITFPPGQISTLLQGNLVDYNPQSYLLKASQGQILTASLRANDATFSVLQSNQQGVDAAAYQTRSWTGQLPADDTYLIQIEGTGAYILDIAITPIARPVQEQTQRVSFAPRQNRTTVTGKLEPKQLRRFLFQAKQGQIIVIKSIEGQANLRVLAPDGQQLGTLSATAKEWKGRLPQNGDYVLETTAERPTPFAIVLEIF